METPTNDPIIALTASEYKRDLSKTTMLFTFMLDWLGYFENDFENDEDQTYTRMKSYVEHVEWMEKEGMLSSNPYRERMVMRVKERMSEVKI